MQLTINDKYRISTDRYNYIVEERKVTGKDAPSPGEEYWVNVSYHKSLKDAIQWLVDYHVRVSDLKDLESIVHESSRLQDDIIKACERQLVQLA